MGKTFKDNRKDHKIVDHRYRKKDKRKDRLDEVTKADEAWRNGHQHYPDSPQRLTRRLGSQDEYDTSKEKDEAPDQGIDSSSRESTCDLRDIGSERQDEGGSGGGDNQTD